jgi:hypothetical protein
MFNAITGSPWWVWAILCYVIFIGIKSRRDRFVYLPKLFILPVIFLALKYQIFTSGNGMLPLIYFLFMLLSFIPAFFLGLQAKVQIIRSTNSVKLPGNYRMICLLLSYFCIKYVLGFLQATDLGLASRYLMLDIAITALFSGYLLGKAAAYAWRIFMCKRS